MSLEELLRLKPDAKLFRGNRSSNAAFVTDGLIYSLTNSGGDAKLLARLAAKKDPVKGQPIDHDPNSFLRSMLSEDGRIEARIGEVRESEAMLETETPQPIGHVDAGKLRLLHAMTGGWDRLFTRPGDSVMVAWRGDSPVGAIARNLNDWDRATADVRSQKSANETYAEIQRQKDTEKDRERKAGIEAAIRRGDAIPLNDKRRANPRERAHELLRMRPSGPFEVTFSIAARDSEGHFLLDASAKPGRRELEVSNRRSIPFAAEGKRFSGARPLSEFLSSVVEQSVSFDLAYPESVIALGSQPVPWDIALHTLRGSDVVNVRIAGSVLPFAQLVFDQGAWFVLEGAIDLWSLRKSVDETYTADPTSPDEKRRIARSRGTAWPLARWKEMVDQAYGGEVPAVEFKRIRKDEYGSTSELRGLASELRALCVPGTLPSPRSSGRLLIHGRGRKSVEIGGRIKDLDQRKPILVEGDIHEPWRLFLRYAPGSLLRFCMTISPPTSGAGSRTETRVFEFGTVEIGTLGHTPTILWHAQGLELPKKPMSLFEEPEAPRPIEDLFAHMKKLWTENGGPRSSGTSLWVDELGLAAPRDPKGARSWIMPDRYRGNDNQDASAALSIVDGERDVPLIGRSASLSDFFRSKRHLNFVSRFANAFRRS